jgi:hypothetical protein
MDRFEKANLDKSDSQPSPSTGSGQALRDWFRFTLMVDLFSARVLYKSADQKKLIWASLILNRTFGTLP